MRCRCRGSRGPHARILRGSARRGGVQGGRPEHGAARGELERQRQLRAGPACAQPRSSVVAPTCPWFVSAGGALRRFLSHLRNQTLYK